MNAAEPKYRLRTELRARRRAFVAAGNAAPIPLSDRLAAHINAETIVAGYLPQRFEADCRGLIGACLNRGARIALPHVESMKKPMLFLGWEPCDPLETNALGIEQPPMSAPELAPDIILTPLVGFDDRRNRLGQGGGFYDRAFAAHPNALRIGLAWSVQQVDTIPVDPWDVPLHAVITERGLFEPAEI
ncbi:5-formyltetrahydrofolate cyclo-ligase [Stakelama flava]|uniref:5-formyltetrahydrofolate cyclo-ligase n=1 Tax=Stakelama flava TaxID=2860338 RepID=UPI0031B9FAF4